MNKDTKKLHQFKDLGIPKSEINYLLQRRSTLPKKLIVVCAEDLIRLLDAYKNGLITEAHVLDWVNVIWFSDFFEYCEEQEESIATIMDKLEEIDEGFELTPERIDQYIDALKRNVEV